MKQHAFDKFINKEKNSKKKEAFRQEKRKAKEEKQQRYEERSKRYEVRGKSDDDRNSKYEARNKKYETRNWKNESIKTKDDVARKHQTENSQLKTHEVRSKSDDDRNSKYEARNKKYETRNWKNESIKTKDDIARKHQTENSQLKTHEVRSKSDDDRNNKYEARNKKYETRNWKNESIKTKDDIARKHQTENSQLKTHEIRGKSDDDRNSKYEARNKKYETRNSEAPGKFKKQDSRNKTKSAWNSESSSRFKTENSKPKTENSSEMPLNKFIAHAGVCGRREAAELVKEGKVKVNNNIIYEPGFKVTSTDNIVFNNKQLHAQKNLVYILLNKPKDYITTAKDTLNRKTVFDLITRATDERVYPVGRLDRNTTGVLLLTNDGELTQKLTHPSFEVKKIYEVKLDKQLQKKDMEAIANGIELEDGFIKADAIGYADSKDKSLTGIEIHSGKNRIVRRLFEHLGYDVKNLDRVLFANLTKKNVDRGKWRFLNEKEVRLLKYMNQSFVKKKV